MKWNKRPINPANKKPWKKKPLSMVERCRICKKILPKFNRHHWMCHKCWKERKKIIVVKDGR